MFLASPSTFFFLAIFFAPPLFLSTVNLPGGNQVKRAAAEAEEAELEARMAAAAAGKARTAVSTKKVVTFESQAARLRLVLDKFFVPPELTAMGRERRGATAALVAETKVQARAYAK